MSHVVSSKSTITDLDCLEAVLAKHFPGMTLVRNKTNYNWYGRWVKDYHGSDAAYKNGVRPEDFGKCDHVIKLAGCEYEVGLCKVEGKEGWTAVWDFYGDGRHLSKAMGDGAEKLALHYGTAFCARFADSVSGTMTVEDGEEERLIEISVGD